MTALAQDVSKLTDRYQTTVPAGVRKQLKLGKGDQIRYCTEPSGRVYIEPCAQRRGRSRARSLSRFCRGRYQGASGPHSGVRRALHDRLAHWSETLTSISMRRYRSRMNERR